MGQTTGLEECTLTDEIVTPDTLCRVLYGPSFLYSPGHLVIKEFLKEQCCCKFYLF